MNFFLPNDDCFGCRPPLGIILSVKRSINTISRFETNLKTRAHALYWLDASALFSLLTLDGRSPGSESHIYRRVIYF